MREAAGPVTDDLIATLSHEVRTPLTTLTGFSELLAQRADALPPQLVAEFGGRMWRASRWLTRLMSDLLDLAAIRQGTLSLNVVATDVASAIGDVTSARVRDRRLIELRVEPGLPPVVADPGRLRQVVGNLVSNARKFSDPEAPVEIDVSRDADRVAVTVSDAGPGILPEELDRIFEPFVQIDSASTRSAGGLGTGLFLARELCVRMGAEMRVESTPGRGSRFTVLLRTAARTAEPALQRGVRKR